jgi:hypothetical protein
MKKKMKKMKKEKKKVIQLAYDVTEVWKYHRSIDKWKDYKLRKGCEVTKRLRNKLRKTLVTKLPNYVVVIRIC